MSLYDAARALLTEIHAPSGLVNVLPLDDEEGQHLLVWVDSQYLHFLKPMPDSFEGYPVRVESKPQANAGFH